MIKDTQKMPRTKTTKRRSGKVPEATKKYVKQQTSRKIETKYVVETATSHEITDDITLQDLTDSISQGDGVGNRDGDQVELQRISGRMLFTRDSGAAAGSVQTIRCLFFQWHPDNNTESPSNINEIVQVSSSAALAVNSGYPINKSTRHFTPLLDRTIHLAAPTNDPYRSVKSMGFAIPKHKLRKLQYNAAATTGKNHVYVVFWSDKASGAENGVCTYVANVFYKDG